MVFRCPNPSRWGETAITDQAVKIVMRRFEKNLGWDEPYRPHGLRTTFRSWAEQEDPMFYTVVETALTHKVGGVVERTYQPSDLLEKREELYRMRARFLLSPSKTPGKALAA